MILSLSRSLSNDPSIEFIPPHHLWTDRQSLDDDDDESSHSGSISLKWTDSESDHEDSDMVNGQQSISRPSLSVHSSPANKERNDIDDILYVDPLSISFPLSLSLRRQSLSILHRASQIEPLSDLDDDGGGDSDSVAEDAAIVDIEDVVINDNDEEDDDFVIPQFDGGDGTNPRSKMTKRF